MMDCLDVAMAPWEKVWKRILFHFCFNLRSLPLIYPAIEIDLHGKASLSGCSHSHEKPEQRNASLQTIENKGVKRAVYVFKPKGERRNTSRCKNASANQEFPSSAERYASNWGSNDVSLFTKQGGKGVNQDAMVVWKNFASQEDMVFCGVFDGHGPDGHRVAQNVRYTLPQKLADFWKSQQPAAKEIAFSSDDSENESYGHGTNHIADPSIVMGWKECFTAAYKVADRELLINEYVDSISSGTTAVSLVKQGNNLIVGNVGDSRAVLGTRSADNSLVAVQLTVDLKPDVPKEAERIRRNRGRVFALRKGGLVKRVWLPDQDAPGLAMSRSLGDYCLKNYGVISEPEVTYRTLTPDDEFVVLATDGVWDVLTNEQVVDIVASTSDRSQVARAIVEAAVNVWNSQEVALKADDCSVVCLFLC
ncbi:hypothetical protein KP509_07G005900 [Ceratopteris richardii]|uniref:PPM-type phosphatase domain-containing protein n=1 Tax=Ceratopteris richardii TaxID=49495 RepID=A0A8T2U896_CERRI|nr:hypothetical protein KP509_07G005900 [Ceratopteris richardii]